VSSGELLALAEVEEIVLEGGTAVLEAEVDDDLLEALGGRLCARQLA